MKIVIIGGVAGGASAAARARRLNESATIIIFERGEHISFANCGLPYHIGGTIKERERLLVQTPEAMRRRFNIDVRTRTEVLSIDPQARTLRVRDLKTGRESDESYDALVLSPGAEPLRPALRGIDSPRLFTLRSLTDMDRIIAALERHPRARTAVIGGGYIGLEMAEALRQRDCAVTLIELKDQVMDPLDKEMAAALHQELAAHGVELRLGTAVKGFRDAPEGLVLELGDGAELACDLAILAIGVRPESGLARDAGLAIGERGGITVDEHMRTSDPSIYAVGDAVEVEDFITRTRTAIPLAGPANRQGRIAADNICGILSTYRKTQGTAICKVFGLSAGMTGLNEKQLKRQKLPFEKVYIHPTDHAGYYPGATLLHMKLLFDPSSGKILGAQAVGRSGVDKRIDVMSTALRAGMTVNDLKDLELAYAPPFGSAKDPVNSLGFIASSAIDGTSPLCHVDDVIRYRPDQVILDVRTPEECRSGMVPGAINIPLDDLRQRFRELPADKEILVYCRVGLRGHVASRLLQQLGLRCRNLSGGYLTYQMHQAPVPLPTSHPQPEVTTMTAHSARSITRLDACGLQCPGPIMRLKQSIDAAAPGDGVEISATDPGFVSDIRAWCLATGHELSALTSDQGRATALVIKKERPAACPPSRAPSCPSSKTIVVFSSDLDRVLAAFVIANGAAAMGSTVTMFFTFWGINALRKPQRVPVAKNIIERMFGWMMPRGADRLTLSKMHLAGAGTTLMKAIMRHKNVAQLPELIASARGAGVKLVACTMSMDLMGIKKEELIDGVEEGGVAMYLQGADQGNVNLFI